jgi:hypothetical protein
VPRGCTCTTGCTLADCSRFEPFQASLDSNAGEFLCAFLLQQTLFKATDLALDRPLTVDPRGPSTTFKSTATRVQHTAMGCSIPSTVKVHVPYIHSWQQSTSTVNMYSSEHSPFALMFQQSITSQASTVHPHQALLCSTYSGPTCVLVRQGADLPVIRHCTDTL